MKAIAFTRPLPIEAQDSLVELDLPQPEFGPRNLLVNVRAVSVNPVDTKVRGARHQGSASENTGKPRVLGWDAAGVTVGKGAAVTAFDVGDEAYYAGALDRPGSNAEYQAVDERLVGHKPKSIGFAESAALPLTALPPGSCCSIGLALLKAKAARLCWSAEPLAAWVPFSCNSRAGSPD
jgi:NADPH2:quinone reductase